MTKFIPPKGLLTGLTALKFDIGKPIVPTAFAMDDVAVVEYS